MKRLAVILIVVLLLTMSTAAFAAYDIQETATERLVSDQGVVYILQYPSIFKKSTTQFWLEIESSDIKTVKGLSPQGTIRTDYSSVYPYADDKKDHNLVNDKPDNDCTKTYEYSYWFGIDPVNNHMINFKLTRTAMSAHNWSEWMMDANGNHVRICKHPVCTVMESHTPGEWFSDETGLHRRTCEKDGCSLVEEAHEPSAWIPAGDVHVRTCDVAYCSLNNESAPHTGGIATTTEKAICTACGAEYGSLAIPETGDGANPVLWIALTATGAAGMAMMLRRKKKV